MIEKVYYDFLRKITRSKKGTGRIRPVSITHHYKSKDGWLLESTNPRKNTKLSLVLYQCLRFSRIRSKWRTHIQNIFSTICRPDIRQVQRNFNRVTLSSYMKSVLTDQYLQKWHSKDAQSS